MKTVIEKKSKEDAIKELYSDVSRWVNSDFNYIDVSVYEKMADGNLSEYILQEPLKDYAEDFQSYLTEDEVKEWIIEFLDNYDNGYYRQADTLYVKFLKESKDNFAIDVLKEVYPTGTINDLTEWLLEHKEDELREFSYDNENYPMWNTLFEFKNNYDSTQGNIDKAQEVGLGVIEGLEPFNTTLFAMSCGHSFYASYWMPLYLSMWTDDNGLEKYGFSFKRSDYDHL